MDYKGCLGYVTLTVKDAKLRHSLRLPEVSPSEIICLGPHLENLSAPSTCRSYFLSLPQSHPKKMGSSSITEIPFTDIFPLQEGVATSAPFTPQTLVIPS